ncbi:hypothetical protein D9758_008439 [Tetrapyrgos nigripes]|uniref:Uncharacterized protein n=1 Tax=Tetrapyrgos nigripes TaxID=182062 RepID=A0A8H5FQQ2_9AGAR|nr:hypothetical protein D9758_008439 [Tetrapyrgos nigripes]
MSKPHFLCCLPIRLGAFLVSLATFLLSLLIAGVGWYAVYFDRTDDDHTRLSTRQFIFLIINCVVYTLLCLTSLFGLFGVISKRISWIANFKSYLQGFTFGLTVIAIINIVLFFVDRDGDCDFGSDKLGTCVEVNLNGLSRTAVIVIAIVFFVVPLLIMAYGCWILSDCVKYLYEKEADSGVSLYPFSSKYAAVPNHDRV